MRIFILIALVFFLSCTDNENNKTERKKTFADSVSNNEYVLSGETSRKIKTLAFYLSEFGDTIYDFTLVNVTGFTPEIIFEMVYASENNFFKQKLYDCPNCYLRFEVAKALHQVVQITEKKGYRLKIFDCFRPFSVQKKMWEILPNRAYVADPSRGGSIHNKGAAIDLTITDENGTELDMGTEYDHFGPESAHSYLNMDSTVIENRKLLRSVMEECGFVALETEWWHYTFKSNNKYKNADLKFDCE